LPELDVIVSFFDSVFFVGGDMNINDFYNFKKGKERFSMITCYDYTFARIIAEADIDCVLVGDSLAMVMYGYGSTIKATMDMMKMHTRAVKNGIKNKKMIIADMPFMSFRTDKYTAAKNASELVMAGADAVKLEGVDGHEDVVEYIIKSGIPVIGHLGLTPQYIKLFGGYSIRGRDKKAAQKIMNDALRLERLGCFSIVIECVPEILASEITKKIKIPTIGIGSGKETDGQVLVLQDMLGLFPDPPSFVKQYLNLSNDVKLALNRYTKEIKGR
jgi:3-methyl-2-oxobutanoate hydroxymethyltransferase